MIINHEYYFYFLTSYDIAIQNLSLFFSIMI